MSMERVFCSLKNSPCVMVSHLCFFVFVWGVLDVCSKIKIFFFFIMISCVSYSSVILVF